MKTKVYALTIIGLLSLAGAGFCQHEPRAVEEAVTESMPAADEISWVWGEVKEIDSQAAKLTVIYMDYQTDEEKELLLITDAETKFEGVKDISGIKIGDTASIDYALNNGQNIARNISIENIEAMPETPGMSDDPLMGIIPEEKAQ